VLNRHGHDLVEVALEERGFDFQEAVEVALVAGDLFDDLKVTQKDIKTVVSILKIY
jgi:DNA repair exonuclease SbcCD nuclease subunit